jgi:membrane protein required for colicin V production
MVIDIILMVLLALAIFKGISRGLVVALFSFLSIIIGLAAAVKLSAVVANWLQKNTSLSNQWLPFLSFLIVIICVALLVRWAAGLVQKSMEYVMMGWVNRLGGVVFYVLLYVAVYSILLFYATQMSILKPAVIQASKTYPIIEPLGPKAINAIGALLPVFKNLFSDLENFFGSIGSKK